MVSSLTSILYKQAPRGQVEVAALHHIYHLCLEDRFSQARDLLLMLHIQENISNYDISTVILFNRTMTQLGLAAFRAGLMAYAHNCLDDLVNIGSRNGMLRVLIAQGCDNSDEEMQALQERRKVPAHMVGDGVRWRVEHPRGSDRVLLSDLVYLHGHPLHDCRCRRAGGA